MGLILNFAKWQKLHEQSASFTTFAPGLPAKTAGIIIDFLKQNQWSTGGWIASPEVETVLFKVDDSHNKGGNVVSMPLPNNPVNEINVSVFQLFMMDKTPESFPLTQLSLGSTYNILSKQGSGEGEKPIAEFTAIGTTLKNEKAPQYSQTNKYGFAALFVTPENIEYGAALYPMLGQRAKDHFKKQVAAIAAGGIVDKDAKHLNQYKASAAQLLSKLG